MAFAGWVAVDAGLTFPGEQFQGIKSLEAHDIAVANGAQRPGHASRARRAAVRRCSLARELSLEMDSRVQLIAGSHAAFRRDVLPLLRVVCTWWMVLNAGTACDPPRG